MCVSLESYYQDFVTLFAGRYRNYNSVVIWSLSIDIFDIFVYLILLNSNYFINFQIPIEDTILMFLIFQKEKRRHFQWSGIILQIAYKKVFEFWAAIRGYQYYRKFWIHQKDQILEYFFETPNPFDCFEIKVYEVDHLPQEISGVRKFFMDREAILNAQLTSEHYLWSPIAQGVMEITCKVTVKIPSTCINILLMEKYKQLVYQLYIQPKNEETLGSFLQPIETIDGVEAQPVLKNAKVKRKQTNKTVNRQKEIRIFFKNQGIITNTEICSKRPSVITIDK